MKCENCQNYHDGTFATGRFCSRKCACGFSRKKLSDDDKALANEKTRASILKTLNRKRGYIPPSVVEKQCVICNSYFKKNKATCSRSCAAKLRYKNLSDDDKKKFAFEKSNLMRARHESGDTRIGWQIRKTSSYPEVFFEKLLEINNIKFSREVKIGKWFADFLIAEIFVLEIDGRQHADRKEKDAEKDAYFLEHGFHVTRINWKNPKSEKGLTYMIEEFNAWKEIISIKCVHNCKVVV